MSAVSLLCWKSWNISSEHSVKHHTPSLSDPFYDTKPQVFPRLITSNYLLLRVFSTVQREAQNWWIRVCEVIAGKGVKVGMILFLETAAAEAIPSATELGKPWEICAVNKLSAQTNTGRPRCFCCQHHSGNICGSRTACTVYSYQPWM